MTANNDFAVPGQEKTSKMEMKMKKTPADRLTKVSLDTKNLLYSNTR